MSKPWFIVEHENAYCVQGNGIFDVAPFCSYYHFRKRRDAVKWLDALLDGRADDKRDWAEKETKRVKSYNWVTKGTPTESDTK